jgi:hypothetical protein
MRSRENVCILCSLVGLIVGYARSATAADTVETWAAGATDVDFYLGADGLAQRKSDKTVFADIMLGYGLADRFSAYLGTTLFADEYLVNGGADIYTGLFGAPIETNHVDLDLFLNVGAGGTGLTAITVTPALELNIDRDPDMRTWGVYLRAGLPLFGEAETRNDEAGASFDIHIDVATILGAYATLGERHQLLIEYDMAFHPKGAAETDAVEVGGVALGYNIVLNDAIELINQLYLDVPQDDEPVSLGIMVGLIATLPAS